MKKNIKSLPLNFSKSPPRIPSNPLEKPLTVKGKMRRSRKNVMAQSGYYGLVAGVNNLMNRTLESDKAEYHLGYARGMFLL